MAWWSGFLPDLDEHSIREIELADSTDCKSADLPTLLRYCKTWCCLSKALSVRSPVKCQKQLLFEIGQHDTDSYWMNLIYWANKLGHRMISKLVESLVLNDKLDKPKLSNAEFSQSMLADLLLQSHEVIGVLFFCSTEGFAASLWVEKKLFDECDQLQLNHTLLRVFFCWMQTRLVSDKWTDTAKWIATTQTLIAHNTQSIGEFETVRAFESDLLSRAWLCRAAFFLEGNNDVAAAGACFSKAASEGLNLTKIGKEIIQERLTMNFSDLEPDSLIEHCEFPPPVNDPVLRGKSPLTFLQVKSK